MPAELVYEDNPFHVLGLRSIAGDREIAARLAAGASQAGRDLNLVGPAEERFRRAQDALRDPLARLRAELFWIAGDDPSAPPELDLNDDQALDRAIDALRRTADDPGGDPVRRAVAAHDLAVVSHAACLHHRWLGPEYVAAVEHWSSVFGDASYWKHVVERARRLGVTMDPLPALREHLAEALAATWIEAAADLLDAGQDDAALALVVAIRLSSLPRYAIDGAIREITLPLRAAVKSGANAVCALADLLDGLAESTPPGWIAHHLETATDQLRQGLGAPLARLWRIAPGADDPALADKVAQASARLASVAIGRLGDWDLGLALAGEAAALARGGTLRGELATLQSQVRHVYHRSQATAAREAGDDAAALAHLELALAAATSAGAADEIRRSMAEIERASGEREKLTALGLAREIETRLPKRLEPPEAPPRPPELRRRRIVRAEALPDPAATVEETAAVERPVASGAARDAPERGTAAGFALLAKPTSAVLNRSLNGPRYLEPEVRPPGPASRVVAWLSVPTHAAQVGLPLAAVFLLAVALNTVLPWRGWQGAVGSGPAVSDSADRDASEDSVATGSNSGGAPSSSQAGGVVSDPAGESTAACLAATQRLDAEVATQRELLDSIDRQIRVITRQFPTGGYPGEIAALLRDLQQQRSNESAALTTLLAQTGAAC
jgi:hypothetical protein